MAKIPTDLVWLKHLGIVMRYWMMWPHSPSPEVPQDNRTAARGFALLIIIALTFAIRGEIGPDEFDTKRFAAIAAGLAVVLSVVLQVISKRIQPNTREQIIMSAYASIIWVMMLAIAVSSLRGIPVMLTSFQKYGEATVAVVLACAITYVLFLLKAVLVDRVAVSAKGLAHGLLLICGAGIVARLVSVVSTETFLAITNWLKA